MNNSHQGLACAVLLDTRRSGSDAPLFVFYCFSLYCMASIMLSSCESIAVAIIKAESSIIMGVRFAVLFALPKKLCSVKKRYVFAFFE